MHAPVFNPVFLYVTLCERAYGLKEIQNAEGGLPSELTGTAITLVKM